MAGNSRPVPALYISPCLTEPASRISRAAVCLKISGTGGWLCDTCTTYINVSVLSHSGSSPTTLLVFKQTCLQTYNTLQMCCA
ncbi:hypothetical protein FKM82_014954 [Ascaphus truei]